MKHLPRKVVSGVFASAIAMDAAAQIITLPPPPAAIPAGSFWSTSLLIAVLLTIGLLTLLRQQSSQLTRVAATVVLLAGVSVWHSPRLQAQLALVFTDPAGESVAIPVNPLLSNSEIVGFEAADYSNASGSPLIIDRIEPPVFEQCFPDGLREPFPAAQPVPSPHPLCSSGMRLEPDSSCRLDVEQACRDAEEKHQASLQVEPAAITLEAFADVGEFTLTNGRRPRVSVENLLIQAPPELTVTGNCGTTLAPGASCTMSVTANGVGGPEAITISADNSYDQTVAITATEWTPDEPVSSSESLALSRMLARSQSCNPFDAVPFDSELLSVLPEQLLDLIPATSAAYSEKGFDIRTCGNITLLVQWQQDSPVRTLLLIEGDIQPTAYGLLEKIDQSTLTDTIVYQVKAGFEADALSAATLPSVLAGAVTRSYGGSLSLKAGRHITGRVTLAGLLEQVVSAMHYPTENVVLTTGRELPPRAWQTAAAAGAGATQDGTSFNDGLKPTRYIELAHQGTWTSSAGIQGLTLIDTTVYYDEDNNFGFWGTGNFNSNPVAMFYNGPLKVSKDPLDYLGAQLGFGALDITLGDYLAFMAAYQARYPNLAAGATGTGSTTDTLYDGVLTSLNALPLDVVAVRNERIATLNFKSGDPFPDLDYFNLVALGPLATSQDGTNGPLFKLRGDGELFNQNFGTVDFTASASGASGTASGNIGIGLPAVAGVSLGSFGASSSLSISASPTTRSMTLNGALQAGPLGGLPLGLMFTDNQVTFSIAPSCAIPTALSGVATLSPPLRNITPSSLSWSPSASLPDPAALLGCASDIFVLLENGVVYVFQAGQQLLEFGSSLLPDNQVTEIGLEGIKFANGALISAPAEILDIAGNIPGATALANAASAVQDEVERLAAEAAAAAAQAAAEAAAAAAQAAAEAAAAAAAAAQAAITASISFASDAVLGSAGAAFDAIGDLIGSIGSAFSSFFGSGGGPAAFGFVGPGFLIGDSATKIQSSDISIGHNGAVWIIRRDTGKPYKYRGPGTFRFDLADTGLPAGTTLVRIDGGPSGGAAGIASNGELWIASSSASWSRANGYAVDVGIGGNYIWVTSSESGSGGYAIYRAPFTSGQTSFAWENMGGHGVKIDVGGDGCAWTIQDNYNVWEWAVNEPSNQYADRGWQNRNFQAIDIAVSATNKAWFTGFDYAAAAGGGRLWVYNIPDVITGVNSGNPIWEVLAGRADNIAAGNGTGVWVENAVGDIFAGTGRVGEYKVSKGGYFPCQ